MKYTIKDFEAQFPADAECLDYIFKQRYPNGITCAKCARKDTYTRIVKRRAYACICGHQVSPTSGTIYHKSPTSLRSWFFAMFLMSTSKNGVSAKEIERAVGVTYKCAWRMAHQIRQLMKEEGLVVSGIVEADETFIGGKRSLRSHTKVKTPVLGVLERGGNVIARALPAVTKLTVIPNVMDTVKPGSTVMTDDFVGYHTLERVGYKHASVNHSRKEYVRGVVHTNSIEGFWSQLKRSINGTFHHVSAKHLQKYVNEFAYRYNRRKSEMPMFAHLASGAAEQHGSAV